MSIAHHTPAITVEQDGSEIIIRVRVATAAATPDEPIGVERVALERLGLEYAPILAHAQSGALQTRWVGRRRFTTRAWLLALLQSLPPAADVAPAVDDIATAIQKRALRRARAGGAR